VIPEVCSSLRNPENVRQNWILRPKYCRRTLRLKALDDHHHDHDDVV
jgi:hypothetical protein